jgi:hypothetical protein
MINLKTLVSKFSTEQVPSWIPNGADVFFGRRSVISIYRSKGYTLPRYRTVYF